MASHWDSYPITEALAIRAGDATLLLDRADDDLQWHRRTEDAVTESLTCGPAGDISAIAADKWRRWSQGKRPDQILLRPAMPDLPVVFRPQMPLTLGGSSTCMIYIGIPVWLDCFADKAQPERRITLVPAFDLSKTWFGVNTAGRLGYALKTRARRKLDDLETDVPMRAICTVELNNTGHEPIPLDRVCLDCEHLTIFSDGTRLWTNPVTVSVSRASDPATVAHHPKPPKTAGKVHELVPAREPRSVIERVFTLGFGS